MGLTRGSGAKAIKRKDLGPAADLLRSLANPQRLLIVCRLIHGECAVSELEAELGIRQPSLSQHLGSLREAGIIAGRRKAKAVFYRVSDARAAEFVGALHEILYGPPRNNPRRTGTRALLLQVPEIGTATMSPRAFEAAVFADIGELENR